MVSLYFCCDFLYTAVRVWATWELMEAILKPRWKKRIQEVIWFITFIIIEGLNIYNNSIIKTLYSNVFILVTILLFTLVGRISYYCYVEDVFCGVCLLWTGLSITDFFIQTVTYMCLEHMNLPRNILRTATIYRGSYLVLCTIFLYKIVHLVCKWIVQKKYMIKISLKQMWCFVLLLLLCMIHFQKVYIIQVPTQMMSQWGLFWLVSLFVLFFYLCRFFLRKEEQYRLLQKKNEMIEYNYQILLQEQEEKRILFHDIGRHIQVICEMAERSQTQAILAYIEEVYGIVQKGRHRNLVNHDLLNLVLNRKIQEAEDRGLSIKIDVDDMQELKLTSIEVCTLFSNILDNAIEANLKMPKEVKRWIKFRLIRRGQMLIINVSNPNPEEKLKWEGRIPKTTKLDKKIHGLGMKSILQIIDAYEGHFLAKNEGDIFQLVLYLRGFDI